ncbi:MAG: cysteine--tRNA ligase [Rhodospirillaceae bacterium]|nr:cysteine--tRNA ligase [Rhodospirillaceae bacterium]MBT6402812.1 cysteine--tRNA ligase [Rhodospirillaceae bacterium]MBT6536012.1 cysteine--tRNA ligase [Rhodospirillaceae bacterium]MBT7360867.1 cysteine--tRNA ligase [Rhodospirillaceae bacterium]
MTLHLHNTYTRQKDPFEPIDAANARMYVCGPTVYDDIHIGNARPLVVFDVLARLLRHEYGNDHVTYVRNITDVDDKIIERAAENGEEIDALTLRTTENFHAAAAAVGCMAPDVEPRATDHIAQMIVLIEDLIGKEHAYEAEGHVLFHVPSMPDYGKLSGRNRDEMIAGARVDVAPYKRDPSDFVLWKPSSDEQPGWDSPWGRGRPGWHLECSAMSAEHLGRSFDIHGGGVDLVFPHHENEIAQSRCAHPDESFARYWVHNGYLMSEGEKMAKSVGNFYTVTDLLDEFPGEALRLALLKSQYRQPLDFSKDGVREARQELNRFYRALGLRQDALDGEEGPKDISYVIPADVVSALEDDLNTPLAIAGLHVAADAVFAAETPEEILRATGALKAAGRLLGLLQMEPEIWFQGDGDAAIDALIAERIAARSAKDFARADEIRDELTAQGIVLEDGAGGTTWRREG